MNGNFDSFRSTRRSMLRSYGNMRTVAAILVSGSIRGISEDFSTVKGCKLALCRQGRSIVLDCCDVMKPPIIRFCTITAFTVRQVSGSLGCLTLWFYMMKFQPM